MEGFSLSKGLFVPEKCKFLKSKDVNRNVEMREIKFRAWDGEMGCMLSWEALVKLDSSCDLFHNLFVDSGRDEPMQFIGLQDKKGVDIYEGDIVLMTRLGANHTGVVTFTQGAFWILREPDRACIHFFYTQCEFEVIGNIFENPELMGTEKPDQQVEDND